MGAVDDRLVGLEETARMCLEVFRRVFEKLPDTFTASQKFELAVTILRLHLGGS